MVTLLAAVALQDACCGSMHHLTMDPAFTAMHLSPEPLDWSPQAGRMHKVPVPGGPDANLFIVPPRGSTDSAVIVIHEWWGLNNYIKREAERLQADFGYGVIAVDMYDGKVATEREQAGELVRGVNHDRAHAILKAAIDAARNSDLLGKKMLKIGTLGWCFGGGWSFQAALKNGAAVDACVIYYGMPETDATKLTTLTAPVLGIFGKQDANLGPELVGRFAQAMSTALKPLDIRMYDAPHAFANPSNPRYDKASAEKAWQEVRMFFGRYLASG